MPAKNKIILIILLSIFIILSIASVFNYYQQKEYIEVKNKQSFDTFQQMIDGKIIFFRKHFNARIKAFLKERKDFQQAVIHNNQEIIQKEMNRFFKQLKRENRYSKTLHLIKPDNTSWYRVHKPKNFGDDLSNYRPVVVHVNKYQNAKYGFEAGLHAMAYRVDIPIFYNNTYYGILEYGIDSNLFTSDFTSVSEHIQSAVLLSIETVTKLSLHNKQIPKNSLGSSDRFKLFDDDDFFKGINIESLENGEKFYKEGKFFKPYLYNLLSFDGSTTGKIVIAIDITADEQRYISMLELSLFNQIILILIIFIIVYFAFRFYEKKILRLTELEKQNERIIHQQSKMAAMGEMIGNIAHQWRQPLSTISTIASGIHAQKEYGIFDDSTLSKSMDVIVDQTQYMSQTINDFRDFFKSDKEKVRFELIQAIEQNIKLIDASLKSYDIELKFNASNNTFIYGHQNELTQALLNILNNAKDQLKKLPTKTEKHIEITTTDDSQNIYISILDNGGGINEEIIHKIFDPYFTTKHQSQGTGIGLYMTYEIIVRHFNGSINFSNIKKEINSKTYDCALFEITLPKTEELQ